MPAVVTVATVEKGCGSAQMGELCLPGQGLGSCSRSGGCQGKNQSMLRLMELLQKKRAPAGPGSDEIISATPKTSTPLGIPPCPDRFAINVVVAELKSFCFFLSSPQGKWRVKEKPF